MINRRAIGLLKIVQISNVNISCLANSLRVTSLKHFALRGVCVWVCVSVFT